jgi:hypothetical protein
MSTSSVDAEDAGLLRTAYRTVTPGYRPRSEGSMDAIGWTIFLGILALTLPLLPFLVVVWLLTKVIAFLAAQVGSDEDAT